MTKIRNCLLITLIVFLFTSATLSAGFARQDTSAQNDLDARVEALWAQMSAKERVGQLFIVDFVGQDSSEASAIAQFINEYKVGGVVLFWGNNNIANDQANTAERLAKLTNGLQRIAHLSAKEGGGVFVPLFIVLDHEGDGPPRTHFYNTTTPVPSAMALGATWNLTNTQAVGAIVGQELAAVGVNMLLGPVVDVLQAPHPEGAGDINIRAFGGDPYWVGQMGRAYIRGVHQGSGGRVLTVAKHFPGHGASDRLPDDEVATVNKSLQELQQSDLIPFFAVTRADAGDPLGVTDAMMPSHIRYRGFQGDISQLTRPISLDPQGMTAFMQLPTLVEWRETGLVVCDSLGVEAVKSYYDPNLSTFPNKQIARDALMAGNDLLPIVNYALEGTWFQARLPGMAETIHYFQEQYHTNAAFRARADQAVRQVLRAKLKLYSDLRLEDILVSEQHAQQMVGQGQDSIRQIAEHALTLLHPSPEELQTRLPQRPRFDQNLLIMGCFQDCLSARLQADQVRDSLLQFYGPQGSGQINPERVNTLDYDSLYKLLTDDISEDLPDNPDDDENLSAKEAEVIREQIENADWIILTLINYMPDTRPATGAARDFLRSADFDLRDKKVIAISFHAPYYLDATEISKLGAYWAVYSKVEPCMQAAWHALFQEIEAQGASPVSIEGINYDLQSQLAPDPSQDVQLILRSPPERCISPGTDVIVETPPLLNRNGRIVRDGLAVEFDAYYTDLGVHLLPKQSSNTSNGVAQATFHPTLEGELEIVVRIDGAATQPIKLNVALPTAVPAPPTVTQPTPTRTPALPSTTPTAVLATAKPTQTQVSPTPVETDRRPVSTHATPGPQPASTGSGVSGTFVLVLALLAVGASAALWWRRRSAPPQAPETPDDEHAEATAGAYRPSPSPINEATASVARPKPPSPLPANVTASVEVAVSDGSLIGQNLGNCQITEKIGQGGMGQVYKAYQSLLDRTVAIKVLPSSLVESEEMRRRFQREARAAASLRHPNIIQVHDFGVQGGLVYMVMEYVPGQSLKEHLQAQRKAGKRMAQAKAITTTRQIANALAYAHQHGVIHRDVKPANILLTMDNQPILADFGLVILQGGARYTAPDTLWGSPAYMAPELLEGELDANERSDIYSLGIVFYEMLVGHSPFNIGSVSKLIWQQIHVEPAPPSEHVAELSLAVDEIVLKMLAKDPQKRPAIASKVAKTLERL